MGESILTAQKGYSTFRGIIGGLKNKNAFKDEASYKRLSFSVKTNPKNVVYVEIVAFKNSQFVHAYNSDEKKTMKIEFSKRKDQLPKGYQLIGTTVGEKDCILADTDAIDKILADFKDGDSVFVSCRNSFSEYNGNLQTRYTLQKIYKTSEPIDFEAQDFDPKSGATFTQELTITNVDKDEDTGKLLVGAYIIEARGKDKLPFVQPAQFVVRLDNENQKMVNSMSKQKFGTTMKVHGFVVHGATTAPVTVQEDDEWGDQPTPITSNVKEMEIDKVEASSVEVKRYKESDFEEALQEMANATNAKKALSGESTNGNSDSSKYSWE